MIKNKLDLSINNEYLHTVKKTKSKHHNSSTFIILNNKQLDIGSSASWCFDYKFYYPKYEIICQDIKTIFSKNKNIFINTADSNEIKHITSTLNFDGSFQQINIDMTKIHNIGKNNNWGDYEFAVANMFAYLNKISLVNSNILLVLSNFFSLSFSNSNDGFLNTTNVEFLKMLLDNPNIHILIYGNDSEFNLFCDNSDLPFYFDRINVQNLKSDPKSEITAFIKSNSQFLSQQAPEINKIMFQKYLEKYSNNIYKDCDNLFDFISSLNPTEFESKLKEYFNIIPYHLAYEEICSKLSKNIKSQSDAVETISKYLFLKLNKYDNNLNSFLFLGDSGVGKTELAKQISKNFYNNNIFIIDSTKIQTYDDFCKFIISDDPRDTNSLYMHLKSFPNSLVLFDEIEKSNFLCSSSFLSDLFKTSSITSTSGNELSIKNSIIIFTSNLFSQELKINKFSKSQIIDLMGSKFNSDFVKNLNEFIYFNSLNQTDMKLILKSKLHNFMKKNNIIILNEEEYVNSLFTVGEDIKTIRFYISIMQLHFDKITKNLETTHQRIQAYFSFETKELEIKNENN
ncbi:AAA family ATPase [Mycoplasma seminis]|uniref:AAA family ATPase n=1 Tax=Mycoplasma seminis TaxID=512749 RepID=A0ABY9HC38_9MOLU|nr:AAA family ATPase [Mycoplasma seminis]WLP85769.1 AAA family ATPase [Mycoplasma seminis]